MANGVQLATAYISLNVDTRTVRTDIEDSFKGLDAVGKRAGARVGTEFSSGIRAKLANSNFIKNSLQQSTEGAGNKAATGFFQEFRTTSQRAGALAGLVIGRTIGLGVRTGLAAMDFGASMFARIKTGAANMARNLGSMIAGAVGGVVKGAAFTAVGAVGYTLMAGFQRLEKIDQARGKLRALGNSTKDVEEIMKSATAAVDKTRFSLADSAELAASAVAANIRPGEELTKYLTTVADVAAVTGGSLDELGYVMNEVASANAAYNESLQSLQTRGLPVYQWLAKNLGVTTTAVKDLASEGKISAEQFLKAINDNIGGAALTMGGTVTSAIENMRTAMARLGARFLASILGDDTGELATAKNAIDAFTDKLNELDRWVQANKSEIRQFFTDTKDVVTGVVNALRNIGSVLKEIPGGVTTVATAFLAWKTIAGVAGLLSSLTAINTMLGVSIPASAGRAVSSLGPLAATLSTAVAAYLLLKDNETFGNKGFVGQGGGLLPPLGGFGGPLGVFENSPAQNGVLPTAPGMSGGSTPTVGGIPIPGLQMPNQGGMRIGPGGFNPGSPGQSVKGAPGKGFPTQWSFPSVGQQAGIAPPMTGQGNGPEGWRPTVQSVIQTYGPRYGIPPSAYKVWENALVRQIATESGGNMNSVNPNDTDGRGGRQRVAGVLNFLESTFNSYNVSGGAYMDPVAQIIAAIPYVIERWGVDANGGPLQIGRGQGFADGGKISGPGGPKSDSIVARLSNGEFVVRASMVDKHYGLLQAINNDQLPGFNTGGPLGFVEPDDYEKKPRKFPGPDVKQLNPDGAPPQDPFIGESIFGLMPGHGRRPRGSTFDGGRMPWWMDPAWNKPPPGSQENRNRRGVIGWGFAEGGMIDLNDPEQRKLLDPNTTVHGQAQGAQPGPAEQQLVQGQQNQQQQSDPLSEFIRSAGFTPVAAGNTGVAGTSFVSGLLNMGNEVVSNVIDTGASLAQTAASAAITAGAAAGTFGAAAPAAPAAAAAATYGIQLAANIGKRVSSYGFQMAGIGADALIAQLFPFGAPRWLGYDYTQFLPQLGLQEAAIGTLEQMGTNAINQFFNPQTKADPTSPAAPGDPLDPAAAAQPETPPVPDVNAGAANIPPWMMNQPGVMGFAHGGKISIYDQGGVLKPGDLALNASRTPERILTDKQWDALSKIQPVGGQQPLVKIDAIYGMSPEDVAAQIESKQKLAMMRYSGRP